MTFLPPHSNDSLWPAIRDEIAPWIGERAATLFAYAISEENDCLPSAKYFERILLAAGDDPDHPQVTETEQLLIDWGRLIAQSPRGIHAEFYGRLESSFSPERRLGLLSFAAQIIAMNLVDTVGEVHTD